jgi:hypothetical protein
MSLSQYGAFGFGLVLGGYLYFINRYRKDDITLTDLATILGALGGAAITALFGEERAQLFGAYGIGLASGFFLYFLALVIFVMLSKNFIADYFLDGRRTDPDGIVRVPVGVRQPVLAFDDEGSAAPVAPTSTP